LKGRLKGGGCRTNTKRGQHGQQRQRQRQQRHLQREGEHEKERREAARATAGSKGGGSREQQWGRASAVLKRRAEGDRGGVGWQQGEWHRGLHVGEGES
jgi:hypothetical protein